MLVAATAAKSHAVAAVCPQEMFAAVKLVTVTLETTVSLQDVAQLARYATDRPVAAVALMNLAAASVWKLGMFAVKTPKEAAMPAKPAPPMGSAA